MWRLEKEAEHISLLEVLIHLEAYDDLDDILILTVVVDDFLYFSEDGGLADDDASEVMISV